MMEMKEDECGDVSKAGFYEMSMEQSREEKKRQSKRGRKSRSYKDMFVLVPDGRPGRRSKWRLFEDLDREPVMSTACVPAASDELIGKGKLDVSDSLVRKRRLDAERKRRKRRQLNESGERVYRSCDSPQKVPLDYFLSDKEIVDHVYKVYPDCTLSKVAEDIDFVASLFHNVNRGQALLRFYEECEYGKSTPRTAVRVDNSATDSLMIQKRYSEYLAEVESRRLNDNGEKPMQIKAYGCNKHRKVRNWID
jgi:hypothetical protein